MSAHEASLTLRQIAEWCDQALALRRETTWEEFRADWRKQMLSLGFSLRSFSRALIYARLGAG